MRRWAPICWSLSFLLTISGEAGAQNASLVPADLKFTQEISTRFHCVAWVALQLHDGSTEKFQYDRYPQSDLRSGSERLKKSAGVFARPAGKAWIRSNDGGATSSAVDERMTQELDSDVNVVTAVFRPPTNRDVAQGGTVWRYVSSSPHGSAIDYTFEESREHPKPGHEYPRYTFLKAIGDTEGRLFLCDFAANLRDDSGIIPVTMSMTYLIPVAAGTKIKVYDKDTGKEKLNTITGPDSGWEITTPSSEPPSVK